MEGRYSFDFLDQHVVPSVLLSSRVSISAIISGRGVKDEEKKVRKNMFDSLMIVSCDRCGFPCKLASHSTEEAELLRKETRAGQGGYCPDCAVTDFFKNHSMLAQLLEMNPVGKAMLLDARVQQQFAGILQTGKADARPSDINWQRVHDNWELPFPQKRASARKKKESRTDASTSEGLWD